MLHNRKSETRSLVILSFNTWHIRAIYRRLELSLFFIPLFLELKAINSIYSSRRPDTFPEAGIYLQYILSILFEPAFYLNTFPCRITFGEILDLILLSKDALSSLKIHLQIVSPHFLILKGSFCRTLAKGKLSYKIPAVIKYNGFRYRGWGWASWWASLERWFMKLEAFGKGNTFLTEFCHRY